MPREIITKIDLEKCTGCGRCVRVCPADTLEVIDGKSRVTGERSLQCGQCRAVCPEAAIHLAGVAPMSLIHAAPGSVTEQLLDILQRRRSCRRYKPRPVDPGLLEDLVRAGVTAPSGTNSQKWSFTVVPARAEMERFATLVCDFYGRLNRMAEKGVFRLYSRWFMKDVLGRYWRHYYGQVKTAIEKWHKDGEDQLFHAATAAILVSVEQGASCPSEDALLATQNMLLTAETLGLGTCLIGFAVEAMKRDRNIVRALGIPDNETVYAVIALGHPAVTYKRPAGRKPPRIRYVSL